MACIICEMHKLPKGVKQFWPHNWQESLCKDHNKLLRVELMVPEDHIDRVDYRPPWQMSVAEEIEQEEARETVDAMRWSYKKFKQGK